MESLGLGGCGQSARLELGHWPVTITTIYYAGESLTRQSDVGSNPETHYLRFCDTLGDRVPDGGAAPLAGGPSWAFCLVDLCGTLDASAEIYTDGVRCASQI